MLLLNVSKIIKEAARIVECLIQAHAISPEHATKIEEALAKFQSLFVGLSQLGCFASKEYKHVCGITDQEFLGIPRVTPKEDKPDDSSQFEQVEWELPPTVELGRWLHVPWAIAMS